MGRLSTLTAGTVCMPIVIPADRWEFDPAKLGPQLMPNHGPSTEITTEGILEGLRELESRPEMAELDKLVMESNMYLRGKQDVPNS